MASITLNICTLCHRLHEKNATHCVKDTHWLLRKIVVEQQQPLTDHQAVQKCSNCDAWLEHFDTARNCCHGSDRHSRKIEEIPKKFLCDPIDKRQNELGSFVEAKIQRATKCVEVLENLNLMTMKPEQLKDAQDSFEEMVVLNRLFINGFTECKEYVVVKDIHAKLGPLIDTMSKLMRLIHLVNKKGAMDKLESFLDSHGWKEDGVEVTAL